MMRILGIDPGSRHTGYGVIEFDKRSPTWIAHGKISTRGDDISQRLLQIHQGLTEVIHEYRPQEVAIEQIFMSQNPQSALKLGQARGAAMVAVANYALPLAEYSPRQIKQTVAGYGAAEKTQIQYMIKLILKLNAAVQADAADALAIAICHSHFRTSLQAYQKHPGVPAKGNSSLRDGGS